MNHYEPLWTIINYKKIPLNPHKIPVTVGSTNEKSNRCQARLRSCHGHRTIRTLPHAQAGRGGAERAEHVAAAAGAGGNGGEHHPEAGYPLVN